MEADFEQKIRISFIKVREDIEFLKKEMENVKTVFDLKLKDILALKTYVEEQNRLILNLKEEIGKISTGNQRVFNNEQQYTTMNNNEQQSLTIINNDQHFQLKTILDEKFRHLTDREFSVFMTIYQLEEEIGAVTYRDIANKLNLTEANVRVYVNSLISREYPLYGERLFNQKIKFRVKKEFREANMIQKVLENRNFKNIR